MQVCFHMGAHHTDGDRLVKSLLKNKGPLANEGVDVPGPSRYRKVLAEVVQKLKGQPADAETQAFLRKEILDVENPARLVLSHDNFLGVAARALEGDQLYRLAPSKALILRNLFPEDQVEFFIGMRNPATLVPALFAASGKRDLAAFLGGTNVRNLYWSDMVGAIRDVLPDCPVTVWCNEDTPLIWPSVMREITAQAPQFRFKGGLDVLAEIMAREGMKRLRGYLGSHPPQTEIQRRRIIAAFLEKYAIDEAIEEEIDMPGWTQELVEDLTQSYEDDVAEIARIPGVTVLDL